MSSGLGPPHFLWHACFAAFWHQQPSGHIWMQNVSSHSHFFASAGSGTGSGTGSGSGNASRDSRASLSPTPQSWYFGSSPPHFLWQTCFAPLAQRHEAGHDWTQFITRHSHFSGSTVELPPGVGVGVGVGEIVEQGCRSDKLQLICVWQSDIPGIVACSLGRCHCTPSRAR